MSETSWRKAEGPVKTRRCGCSGQPRRRCDVCDPSRAIFVACSARCLDQHRREQHADRGLGGEGADDLTDRVRRSAVQLNRTRPSRESYAAHRERLGRLLHAAQRGEGLCVLGAGNCDDLDLPQLVRDFGEVHLVDIDGDAMAAAVARAPEAIRDKLVLHAGLDLSGVVDRIDRWGDAFPTAAELAALPGEVAQRIAAAIGRTFDVVTSACLLSQLYLPLRESLLLGMADWQTVFGAVERAHLATLAALTRAGGTGVLALDVTSSHKVPELAAFAAPATWQGLAPAVASALAARQVTPDPDPARLMRWMATPALAATIDRPRVTDPWIWEIGGGVFALVYALVFTRAD